MPCPLNDSPAPPTHTQGLLLTTADKFTSAPQFLRLWRNEALRIFHDRLICPEDKALVVGRMAELVQHRFPSCAEHTLASPILFGDFG